MARPALPLLLLLLVLDLAASALPNGHLQKTAFVRPLQARVALADLVVVAEIVGLSDGRIEAVSANRLKGTAPDRFEIKRRGSAGPPLAIQDRALLLLRGARSPFVLVDEPAETIRLLDTPGEDAWTQAITDVLTHRNNPSVLASAMLEWIDEGPAALRDTALISLGPLLAASDALRDEIALDRAAAAARSELPAEARAISAKLAGECEIGQDRLVAELAGADGLEASSLALALRLGSLRGHADLETLYRRALDSNDPELRRVAARDPATALKIGQFAENALTRLAEEDPDQLVRRAARKTLTRMHR
ncbi:MAG: hypothetical protein GY723_10885 [bacterium]|nr:hypothetical protein [bacterium]MCP5068197.1 hypothetical protein [bacterium]